MTVVESSQPASEIIFLGESVFTEAGSMQELRAQILDAVRCHFDEGKAPRVVRLHFVAGE